MTSLEVSASGARPVSSALQEQSIRDFEHGMLTPSKRSEPRTDHSARRTRCSTRRTRHLLLRAEHEVLRSLDRDTALAVDLRYGYIPRESQDTRAPETPEERSRSRRARANFVLQLPVFLHRGFFGRRQGARQVAPSPLRGWEAHLRGLRRRAGSPRLRPSGRRGSAAVLEISIAIPAVPPLSNSHTCVPPHRRTPRGSTAPLVRGTPLFARSKFRPALRTSYSARPRSTSTPCVVPGDSSRFSASGARRPQLPQPNAVIRSSAAFACTRPKPYLGSRPGSPRS